MLVQLERAGVLQGVAGLALGKFWEEPEADGEGILAVLEEFAQKVGVPTVAELPFGHTSHNCTLPLGALARLDGDAGVLEILEGGRGGGG